MYLESTVEGGLVTDEKADKLAKEIIDKMNRAGDWDKKRTNIPSIYLVRVPDKKLRVKLLFLPTDDSGRPIKRKGYYFATLEDMRAARSAFTDEKLDSLLAAIERINGTGDGGENDDEVFEVS